jgi:hypothetical protein
VAFSATVVGDGVVEGVNDRGVWITTRRGLLEVARAGDPAPGTSPGTTLAVCRDEDFSPTMNVRGQVAFMACLSGPDVTNENSRGIFAMNTRGDLVKIARTGDIIAVGPGQFRMVRDLRLRVGSGGGDGRGRSFSNGSELAFWAALGDLAGAAAGEAVIVGGAITSTLAGDANGDGIVDRYDAALLAEWWSSEDFWEGDFDLDGRITVNDLGILQQNYGFGWEPGESPGLAAVPEPSALTTLLALVLATGLIGRLRRRGSFGGAAAWSHGRAG